MCVCVLQYKLEIKHSLNLEISARTVRRRLNEAGLFSHVPVVEANYTPEQLQRRQAFGEGYKHFTENDWKLVIFSDEKKFTCDSHAGRIYVQRPSGHRYDPQYMIKKHTHNKNDKPATINAIAFFCGVGKGFIYCYEEELTSKFLIKILKQHFIPAANKLYPTGEDYIVGQ